MTGLPPAGSEGHSQSRPLRARAEERPGDEGAMMGDCQCMYVCVCVCGEGAHGDDHVMSDSTPG